MPIDFDNILITEEQKRKIYLVRIAIGDVPQSIFYPILTDEEIYLILEEDDWNVRKAIIRCAIGAAFQLSMLTTREKTADIEVWNSAASEYRKVLENLMKEPSYLRLPERLRPYAAGISQEDYQRSINDPDFIRSSLFQITPCTHWWTRVDGYDNIVYREII